MTASSTPPIDYPKPPGATRHSREAARQPVFDGVRGIASLCLLVVHVAFVASLIGSFDQKPSNYWGSWFVTGFQVTIGIFFTLSGLFLYRPFARAIIAGTERPPLGPYFLRRALRLLPPYYVMLAVALLLLNVNQIHSAWYVLRPILLLQNYDPVTMAGMDITWTVPTEVQWYLALPLIAWACQGWARRGATPAARARRLMLPVPILIAVGLAWFAYVHLPSMGIFPPQFFWPMAMAGSIGFGMALGIWSALTQVAPESTPRFLRFAGRHPNLFWLAAGVVFLVNCAKPFGKAAYGDYDTEASGIGFYVYLVLFGALVISPMIASGGQSRLIRAVAGNRPIVYIGRISYGVYLWHFPIMNLYFKNASMFGKDPVMLNFLRGRAGFWELETVVLVATIVVASLSYYVLERPILAAGERWIARRRAARTAPVSAVPTPAVAAGGTAPTALAEPSVRS